MTDKKRLLKADQGTELELVTGKVNHAAEIDEEATKIYHIQAKRLRHNEKETNLSTVDAKIKNNKQGTLTLVSANAKENAEVSLNVTKLTTEKDVLGGNAKNVVTAANLTKDAQGNTRMTAITNAGAGKSVKIPAKEGGGVELTHEATVVTEDEGGEQQAFKIYKVSMYSNKIRKEKWLAWNHALEFMRKLPKRPGWDFCRHLILLIFFTFLFLYPTITLIITKEFVALNVISLIIGAIGFAEEIYDIDRLFINMMKICSHYGCCCTHCHCKSEDIDCSNIPEDYETCKCKTCINSCLDAVWNSSMNIFNVPRKAVFSGIDGALVYAGLICALMAFINERSWELKSATNYVDCILLVYSIIAEAIFPRIADIIWLYDAINRLQREYFEVRKDRKMKASGCYYVWNRFINPLGLAPIFCFLILILHLLMLGCIAARLYADNFFNSTQTSSSSVLPMNERRTEREVGLYKVSGYTWFTIAAGFAVPFLSVVTYSINNQYWIWTPLHYTRAYLPGGLSRTKRSYIESMGYCAKCMGFILDPIAWISNTLLLGSFITFAVFSIAADTDYEEEFPKLIDFIFSVCRVGIFPTFMIANIQTILFGLVLYNLPYVCFLCICAIGS